MADRSLDEQMAALIEEEVARGMAPYRALDLPAEVLEEMERALRFGLDHHPAAQALLRRLCEDPRLATSGKIPREAILTATKKGLA